MSGGFGVSSGTSRASRALSHDTATRTTQTSSRIHRQLLGWLPDDSALDQWRVYPLRIALPAGLVAHAVNPSFVFCKGSALRIRHNVGRGDWDCVDFQRLWKDAVLGVVRRKAWAIFGTLLQTLCGSLRRATTRSWCTARCSARRTPPIFSRGTCPTTSMDAHLLRFGMCTHHAIRMTSVFQCIFRGCAITKFAKSMCQRDGVAEEECEILHSFSVEHSLPGSWLREPLHGEPFVALVVFREGRQTWQ